MRRVGFLTPAVALMLALAASGACSDGDSDTAAGSGRPEDTTSSTLSTPTSSGPGTAPPSTTAGASSSTGGSTTDTSGDSSPTTAAPAGNDAAPATETTFEQLFARRQELVGTSVTVMGKSFFVAQCPPPDAPQTVCSLTGYLADPSRDDLLFGDRDEGIPLSENGHLVSCREGSSPGGGCPGWLNAQRYQVVATVEHRVLGGRTTQEVELEVIHKTAA